MPDSSRRWQFGLRTLLLWCGVICVLLALVTQLGVLGVQIAILVVAIALLTQGVWRLKPRFTIAAVCLIGLVVISPHMLGPDVRWVGSADRTLRLHLVCAETKQPIASAVVCVWNDEGSEIERTDTNGNVQVQLSLTSYGVDNLVHRTGVVSFYGIWLDVGVDGYQPLHIELAELTSATHWDLYGGPIPVINVRLERE